MGEPNRADELFAAVESGLPTLEAAGDDRALGRAWIAVAHVRGDFFCEYGAMEEAAARAVAHYSRAGWSASTALSSLGAALFFGPKPVGAAIAQLEDLMSGFEGDPASEANLLMWLGGLRAMLGSSDDARSRIELAKQRYLQLGLSSAANGECERMLGLVAMLAGDPEAAVEHFAKSCAVLAELGQAQVLATRAGELAHALLEAERYDEAEDWTRGASAAAGDDDLDAALAWQPAAARLEARRGAVADAEQRIRGLLSRTPADALEGRARTLLALAEILHVGGRHDEAADAFSAAIELYNAKGNVAAVGAARPLIA
jgi:tetratricopeptide (TPR) repeat protein